MIFIILNYFKLTIHYITLNINSFIEKSLIEKTNKIAMQN